MKYKIQAAVSYIIDDTKPASLRAIKLFTLFVVLHTGISTAKVTGHKASEAENSLILRVSKKTVQAARLLAAMKFLDRIETEWKEANPGQRTSLKKMSQIPEYREIYDKVILRNGSWYRIRYTEGLRQFEADLQKTLKKARDVACVIDFSACYIPSKDRPKLLGSITMAIDIVTSGDAKSFFGTSVSDSQLEAAWKDMKSAAPFFFLLYFQKYDYFWNLIAGKKFDARWLNRAQDTSALIEFFSAYNAVVERIKPYRYHYTMLALPDCAKADLSLSKYDPSNKKVMGVLVAIDNYRK